MEGRKAAGVRPLVCNYYLTFKCNDASELNDLWQNNELQEMQETGAVLVKENLKQLKKLGIFAVNFGGGEPLLYDELPEVLRASKRSGFFNILTTNGILYGERAQDITPFIDHLVFSLDSPVPAEHNRIKGTDCYQSVVDGIKTAKKLGKSPIVSFTVTRDTVGLLPEMDDLSRDLGVLLWINPVYNWAGLEGFSGETVDYIAGFFSKNNIAMNLASLKLIKEGGNRVNRPVCGAGSSVLTIFPDNTLVSPCIHLQKSTVKLEDKGKSISGSLKRREVGSAVSIHGRDEKCRGCMDWSYLDPSFLQIINRMTVPAIYSLWKLFWKDIKYKGART
jgi:MoaA/NifB/PqqE/SkfB family radical SAM enzyme